AFGISGLASTLSKLAMDICLYMSQNFDFISFPNELTTGSRIMPHKKNPDVFELIRAKCNKIQGIANQPILIANKLPRGYHRDLQLVNEIMVPALQDLRACLDMMIFSLKKIKVNPNILDDPKYDYLFSVDTLNELVKSGMPFRDAYKTMGKAIENGNFKPKRDIEHTHQGSLGNLCLDQIKAKMAQALI